MKKLLASLRLRVAVMLNKARYAIRVWLLVERDLVGTQLGRQSDVEAIITELGRLITKLEEVKRTHLQMKEEWDTKLQTYETRIILLERRLTFYGARSGTLSYLRDQFDKILEAEKALNAPPS